MRIIFIDHAFHQRTRSSDFFFDLLASRHSVDRFYFDPDRPDAMASLDIVEGFDVAVLWQIDFLAPLILGRGVRTLVVPMYDGSSLMPDLHWLWSSGACFVNFCRRLHDRISFLGCQSKLVKYFLPPVPSAQRARFDDGLKVLLWQRRPEEGINLSMIETLFGEQLRAIHIHNVPDDPDIDTRKYLKRNRNGYKLTVSTWFEERLDYDRLLEQFNVLIAPRPAEGIGMTMLEGLSRGMLVLAADAPTHDEYIANWINGVLFNAATVSLTNFDAAPEMGEIAWRTARDGHARWLGSELDLLEFVENLPQPDPLVGINLNALGGSLIRAYSAGLESYSSFLLSNVSMIEQMSTVRLAGRLDSSGCFVPDGYGKLKSISIHQIESQWLDQGRLNAEMLAGGRYITQGRTLLADGYAWVIGGSLTIGFKIDPQLGVTQLLRIDCRLPPGSVKEVEYCIVINGCTIAIASIVDDSITIEHKIPASAMRHENQISLFVNASRFAFGSDEPVSLGVRRIEIV